MLRITNERSVPEKKNIYNYIPLHIFKKRMYKLLLSLNTAIAKEDIVFGPNSTANSIRKNPFSSARF